MLKSIDEATKEITYIIISTIEKSLNSKLSHSVKSNTKKYRSISYTIAIVKILRENLGETGVLFLKKINMLQKLEKERSENILERCP